jgi:bacillithiol biosynthesis cysteine-adding enzyme BshC
MIAIPWSELPSSALFRDFLSGAAAIRARFPQSEVTAEFIAQRAYQGASRSRLASLAVASYAPLTYSDTQLASLNDLKDPTSVVVCTGQQIGLYGGPMYTILKIASAAAAARSYSDEFGVPVVPVFWLEDNDHDAEEASTATVVDAAGGLVTATAWDGTQERLIVATRTIDATFRERIAPLRDALSGAYTADVQAMLDVVYTDGMSWGDAFLQLLHPYLSAWGVVVVRGSTLIAEGLHAPIAQKDIANPGMVRSLVATADAALTSAGYTPQAQVAEHTFFVHVDGERRNPSDVPNAEQLVRNEPQRFSPKVVARPIVQDAVLPTVATVLGAAEIAYHAQLREAYDWFGVTMPVVLPRHSATIIDAKTERLLGKLGVNARDMMRPWREIEAEAVAAMASSAMPDDASTDALRAALMQPWRDAAPSIDKTLIASVEAADAAVRKALEQISGKMRAALKRSHGEELQWRKAVHAVLFPQDTLQERVLSLSHWMSRVGPEPLRIIVERIVDGSRTEHSIITAEEH